MDAGKVEKVAAVTVAGGVTALSAFHVAGWHSVGICAHAPWTARLLYPFFHAGVIHAALNAWCLLALVFGHGITWKRMLAAWFMAVTVPVDALSAFLPFDNPTVGLSGVVYVLFGSISFEVLRKRYYQCWMIFYIGIGFFMPNTNAWLHLYCYLCGFIVALLNYPFKRSPHGGINGSLRP